MTVDIPYVKRTLENGLDVIVHEDHGCPLIAVSVWYHVGSKNEKPGRTGFAHLFEHLMFEGSKNHDTGYFQPLEAIGGTLNGSTNSDRTNYWEVVPCGAIERALWLESDRMGYLLPALTEKKFVTQREVVLNERRQNYENRPYGYASMALASIHYPPNHQYHWPTIGMPEDLRAADLRDVQEFFSRFYHPGNASLAIAGDIDTNRALDLADHFFSEIPRGPAVPIVKPPGLPVRESPSCWYFEDRVKFPRLYLSWPTPALFAPGDAALDLLGMILAGDKSAPLQRALLHDRPLVTDVTSGQASHEMSSLFMVAATAAPDVTLVEIENEITSEPIHMVSEGPTEDQLARAQCRIESDFAHCQQTVGGFGGKSDQLNAYNVFAGTPGFFGADLQRYRDIGVSEIREVASLHLQMSSRVALSVVPNESVSLALSDSMLVTVS